MDEIASIISSFVAAILASPYNVVTPHRGRRDRPEIRRDLYNPTGQQLRTYSPGSLTDRYTFGLPQNFNLGKANLELEGKNGLFTAFSKAIPPGTKFPQKPGLGNGFLT
jgi:hypothetical protein